MNAKEIYKAMGNIANDYVGMGREKQAGDSAVLDVIMRVYYTDAHIDFEEVKWLWVNYLDFGKLDFPKAKQFAKERVAREQMERIRQAARASRETILKVGGITRMHK